MPSTKIPAELRPENVRKQLHGFFRLRGTLPAEADGRAGEDELITMLLDRYDRFADSYGLADTKAEVASLRETFAALKAGRTFP